VLESTENFHFPWPILKVALDGLSVLDVPNLQVNTMEEATHFIQAYGYDTNSPDDIEVIWKFFDEAVGFIEKSLSDPEFPKIPEHLRSRKAINDIRRILLLASQRENKIDQTWACAILRSMHVLIHWAHDPRLKYFDQAQNQILSRLDPFLYIDESTGATYLGSRQEKQSIKLLFFKKKDRKDKDREIIKLLHKADNLVEEIYDRIGFRLVTETKFDSMRAVRILFQKNIISIANIRPGRSRNRLVDVKRLQSEIERALHYFEKKSPVSEQDQERILKRIERRISHRSRTANLLNPHSSEYFRSIQFTCRELIRVNNPVHQWYKSLKVQLENIPGGAQVLSDVISTLPQPFEYLFFPYEFQIMDVKSYADSIFGKSSHEEYRRKQLDTARNRVFGRQTER
jgi:uncharacterized protein (TIGR04562 family)